MTAAVLSLPEGLTGCPWATDQIGLVAWDLLFCWTRFIRSGVLPFPGDLGEQPRHVVEAFEICDYEKQLAESRASRGFEDSIKGLRRG